MSILTRVKSVPGLADVMCSVLLTILPASFMWLHNPPTLSTSSIINSFDISYAVSLLSMFLYARSIGLVRQAGVIAAIVYAFNGYAVMRTMSPEILNVYSIIPLALCFIERLFNKPTIWDWLGGATVITLFLVISRSYFPVYALVIIVSYSMFSATLRRMRWKYALKFIGSVFAMCVTGGAIFSAWINKFAAAGSYTNVRIYDVFAAYSIHPISLTTLAFPFFTGGGKIIYSMKYWGGGVAAGESQVYIGVTVMSMAIAGMIFAFKTRYRLGMFWTVAMIIGIVLSLGKYTGSLSYFIHKASHTRQFDGPNKYWVIVTLAVSVLAGYTVDRLVRLNSEIIQGYLRTLALFLTLIILWIGGFILWKKESAEGLIRNVFGLNNLNGIDGFLQYGDAEFYIPMIMASLACATIITFSFLSKRRSVYVVLALFVLIDYFLAAFYSV